MKADLLLKAVELRGMIAQVIYEIQGDRVSDDALRYTGRARFAWSRKKEIKGKQKGAYGDRRPSVPFRRLLTGYFLEKSRIFLQIRGAKQKQFCYNK